MCDVGDTQIYNGISYRIDAVEVRDNMPIWISDSEGGSWYYCKKMKKGDCATIQFGYLVDEDLLDKMVMELNFGDGLQDGAWNFIDMRSAAE